MTCDKCKWWVNNSDHEAEGLKNCEQPKAKIGYRWNAGDIPIDGLWIENDEGWGWFTGPKFGCINFETK